MACGGLICDLDGTLLDTLADIAGAMNAVLVRQGLPPHPLGSYRAFIGSGVQALIERALGPHAGRPALVRTCVADFREAYAATENRHTRIYSGIADMLDRLTAAGIPLAILTNKPQVFARQCVHQLLGRWQFDPLVGHLPGTPLKPDPAAACGIALAWNCPVSEVWLLGDSGLDMHTARCAGMVPVGAGWGYRSATELRAAGARWVLREPGALAPLLGAG